jgi:phenylpropionate dioxygenase-like ring-hydroxylating dioxygenase large terminal subunit
VRPHDPDGETEPQPASPVPALPAWIYGDPELFLAETERLIKPAWQFVGHVKELAAPGDVIWLDIAGETVCALRREDGRLAAGVLRDPWSRPASRGGEALQSRLDPAELDLWNGFVFVRLVGGGPPVAEVWEHAGLLAPYAAPGRRLVRLRRRGGLQDPVGELRRALSLPDRP